jgi:hypothetical protein
MKFKKSAVSILLVMSLIISSIVPSMVFAAAPDNSAAIIRLQQLGVVDGSITDVNSLLTRAQLAKAIAVAKDLTDEAATLSGSTIFPDVESYSELSGYVNALLSRGLMYGRPDGYFHPESGVSYAEACIILVKLLGYTDSDVTGMWPNNYIIKATDLKLNDKITLKKNENITVGVAAVMLDRLLDTNMKKANAAEVDKTFSEYVSLYTDIVVYDNALTYSSLAANAVLTNKGTFYLSDSNVKLQAGSTYRVILDGSNIEKVYGKVKEVLSVAIDSTIDNRIYYKENGVASNMTLPSTVAYYYHGVKQNYEKLNDILKMNTVVVFGYNDNNTGYEYAVIVDPIYSKPQVVEKFDLASDKLGNITFDASTKIIKNGQIIAKSDIEEMDVVYSVTDVNGNNSVIYVYNDRAEGNIKGFSLNGLTPNSIQIDSSSYSFSKDIRSAAVSNFKEGDKVAALLGYDGKVVEIRKIDYKTGNEIEIKILGNNKTSDNLIDHQVLTDAGKYYVLEEAGTLEVGGEYKANIDGDTIVKIKKIQSNLEYYSIWSVSEDTIYYGGEENIKGMTLPRISAYYYHGQKIDYGTVLESLKLSSSLILAKKDGLYSYGIIVDPVYSKPVVKSFATKQAVSDMVSDDILFIYRGGEYYHLEGFIEDGDVVYSVSDLWNINKYIYVADTQIKGRIKSIAPNTVDPKSIQIDNVTYSVSKYFDASKLKKAKVDSYVKITLDKEGKVIDIDIF